MTTPFAKRLWLMWLVGCAVLTVARAAVPESSAAATILTDGTPVLSAGAIVAGVLIHRPEPALPWFLMLTALLSGMAGNIVLMINTARGAIAFPSLSDVFWLLEYPILVAAVMMFIRGFGWRRDRAGILDTLIISTGLGLATWLLFIRDLVGRSALPLDARLVGIAYPLADLLLLSAMVRFLTASARRNAAFWQVTASIALLSGSHLVYLWQTSHGLFDNSTVPGFMLSGLLLAGAALHPSMTSLGSGGTSATGLVTTARVVIIGSAALICPLLLLADGFLDSGDVGWLAASLCCLAVFGLVIARMIGLVRTVQDQSEQLEALAYIDGLTAIPNRRAWDAELERRLAVVGRQGGTLIVGIIDIDHFKQYNDRFGHPAGDALLRDAAQAWQTQLRAEDMIARYGGEEFGVILHARLSEADTIMERMRAVTPAGQHFSAGVAQWTGGESATQLIARADGALYAAKREGRDRVTFTGDPLFTDLTSSYSGAHR